MTVQISIGELQRLTNAALRGAKAARNHKAKLESELSSARVLKYEFFDILDLEPDQIKEMKE